MQQCNFYNFGDRSFLHIPLTVCKHSSNWVASLPLVLLGIRTAPKEDLHCSIAELVYGTTLRIPGEFFSSSQIYFSIMTHQLTLLS